MSCLFVKHRMNVTVSCNAMSSELVFQNSIMRCTIHRLLLKICYCAYVWFFKKDFSHRIFDEPTDKVWNVCFKMSKCVCKCFIISLFFSPFFGFHHFTMLYGVQKFSMNLCKAAVVSRPMLCGVKNLWNFNAVVVFTH